jgi:tetratricopeptide (TPR) repeat protein
VRAVDPHNTALQFLSELGIVGFLLLAGAVAAAALGITRARARSDPSERPAVTALALGLLVWLLHLLVDMDWRFLAVQAPFLVVAGALLGAPGSAEGRRESPRRLVLAAATGAFALVAVYSLAAPWLGRREVREGAKAAFTSGPAAAVDHFRRARTYDPLSVDALTDWAALETGAGNLDSARSLLRKALSIEPHNSDTWFQLGDLELYKGHRFVDAYVALNNSYTWDEFGPAAQRCGDLDVARRIVLRAGPTCPRQVRAVLRAAGLGAGRRAAP